MRMEIKGKHNKLPFGDTETYGNCDKNKKAINNAKLEMQKCRTEERNEK
jgi:hypothetical protein